MDGWMGGGGEGEGGVEGKGEGRVSSNNQLEACWYVYIYKLKFSSHAVKQAKSRLLSNSFETSVFDSKNCNRGFTVIGPCYESNHFENRCHVPWCTTAKNAISRKYTCQRKRNWCSPESAALNNNT